MQVLSPQILLSCLEESEHGIILLDSAKQVIFWNRWLSNTTNIPNEQVFGRTIEDIFPEMAKLQVTSAINKALNSGITSVLLPYLNGSPFPLYNRDSQCKERLQQHLLIKPIVLSDVSCYCLIQIYDVTNSMSRECQLREQVHKLETQVKELQQAKEVMEQVQQVKQKCNSAQDTFLANMPHKLHTPLNAILGYTQILKRDKTLNLQQQEWINIIHNNCTNLFNWSVDILTLFEMENNQVKLCPNTLHLPTFFKGITTLFQQNAEQKNISFIYEELSPLPTSVYIDEQRLRQILNGMLSNAIEATIEGKISLKVGYYNGKMRLQVQNTGLENALLEQPDQVENLFAPSKQVEEENYQTKELKLGLILTRKLVDLMGGRLHIEKLLNKGNRFWLLLDLPEASEQVGNKSTEQTLIIGFQGQTHKILVVDDKRENRLMLTYFLESLGFEVMEADNGQDAIDKACKWQPNLILMDLVMPVMDGIDATRQIRQIPELKDVIIVAISANTFSYNKQESMEVGCNTFITKPVDIDILLECLQTHLNLTWTYQQENVNTTLTTLNEKSKIPLVAPSIEQATVLYNLAKSGDMKGIIEFAKQLKKIDEQLVPFATKLNQLANNLQKKKICQLVQQYCVKRERE